MMNLHKLYYKDYFNIDDWNNLENNKIDEHNSKLTGSIDLSPYNDYFSQEKFFEETNPIELEVLYPGLVTGVGINHETKKIKDEFKLGIHFDWTTGMPVIYGSSVKGVLKSYFEDFYDPDKTQPSKKEAEDDIFDGKNKQKVKSEGKDEEIVKSKSIYNRDIFFDAIIVNTEPKKGRILCSDSITPHGDNPLKNPTPITFMKIAPGCHIKFRFKLVDTKIGDKVLTAQDKLKIFKKILTTVGIGVKTNVGYGQLKSVN